MYFWLLFNLIRPAFSVNWACLQASSLLLSKGGAGRRGDAKKKNFYVWLKGRFLLVFKSALLRKKNDLMEKKERKKIGSSIFKSNLDT